MTPSERDMTVVAELARRLCGIVIGETKSYLVETRLGRMAQEHGEGDYTELCKKVVRDASLQEAFVNAITTNETLFFRDEDPFHVLQNRVIPMVCDDHEGTANPRRLRIWSAACATGQEPWSLAMVIHQLIPDMSEWDIEILASDISEHALERAKAGVYSDFEIERGLPDRLRDRYFEKVDEGWRVRDGLRSIVRFERRNLLEPFTSMGPFDVVMCRNVAIYFDKPVQQDLFNRMSDRMTENGFLFVGVSESLTRFGDRFVPQFHCRTTYYQPNLKELPPKAA